jgi:Protein of unknown function (DUF3089)
VLRRLIRKEIDPTAAERKRLVSAILLGGNVTVRKGSDRGGDFQHLRACGRPREVGCVTAFSTFNAPVPADALFGRTRNPALEVLCTNPAALGGGSGRLTPVYPSKPFAPQRAVCRRSNDAEPRTTNTFTITPTPDATWGTHLVDANIALGNLTNLVRRQIAIYVRR